MAFDLLTFTDLLTAAENATTAADKGARFEGLIAYLFECLDGVEVVHRDAQMASEEIDLVLWNAQTEPALKPWEGVILVECKNWSAPVGAPALDSFLAKMRRRSMETGIFVVANGVTGDFFNGAAVGAHGLLVSALQEGIRVIIIRLEDLKAINSADDLRRLIKQRYCGLYVHKFQ